MRWRLSKSCFWAVADRPVTRVGHHFRGARVNLFEYRLALRGEVQAHRAPVERVVAPLDPARALHPVDEPRDGDRLGLEALGERHLVHSLAAGHVHDGAPLGLRKPQRLEPAIEVAAQQPCDVADQHAEAAVGVEGFAHAAVHLELISMLIISMS